MTITPIRHVAIDQPGPAEPFNDPDLLFEAKFDGFRAAADTFRGQLAGNRMQQFEEVLDLLPAGLVGRARRAR